MLTNRIGLSVIAIDSDGGGSAAGLHLLTTLFYDAMTEFQF